VADLEVILGEDVEPVDHPVGEAGLGEDVADSPVVGVDDEVTAEEIVFPDLKGLDNGEELEIMGGVAGLGGGELGGVEGDDAFRVAGALGDGGAGGVGGGVGVEGEGLGEVRSAEDGGGGEGGFEGGEGCDGGGGEWEAPVVVAHECGVEGGGNGGVAADETAVVVGEAEEGSEVGDGGGEGPSDDGGDFGGVGGDTVLGDDVAYEVDGRDGKGAFGGVGKEMMVLEELEGGGEVAGMVFLVLGEDKDVVEVDDDEVVKVGAEDIVHEALEGGGGVGEAEGHDRVFEVAVAGAEGGLVDVLFGDPDLVIAVPEVDFGEDGGAV
jgi:hypothetical protein